MPDAECVSIATSVKSSVWNRALPELSSVHHGSGSPLPKSSYRMSFGKPAFSRDLVISTESLDELQEKLILWKTNMEGKGLRVNMEKPRSWYLGRGSMFFRSPAETPVPCVSTVSAQTPFSVVAVAVGSTRNAVISMAFWSLIPASGVNGGTGQARPIYIDGRPMTEAIVGGEKLEVLLSCYLGDWLSSGGGFEHTTITKCRVAWGKFNELLPIPTSHPFPITSRGRLYNSCVRSAMLHANETWAPVLRDLHHLQRNDRAIIRWMCGVTTKDKVISQDRLERRSPVA